MRYDLLTSPHSQRLFGDTVLATNATLDTAGPPPTNVTEGGDRARVFSFCSSESVKSMYGASAGAVSVALVNFDPQEPATFHFDKQLGTHQDYLFSPGSDPVVASMEWSSREMMLNGELLEMRGPDWTLPEAITGSGKQNDGGVVLPPLHVGFVIFPAAAMSDCMSG